MAQRWGGTGGLGRPAGTCAADGARARPLPPAQGVGTEGPASGIDGIGGIGGGGGGGGGREVPALRRKLSIWSSMQEVEAALTEGKQVAASSSAASGVREGVNGGSLAPSLTPALTPGPRPTPTLQRWFACPWRARAPGARSPMLATRTA